MGKVKIKLIVTKGLLAGETIEAECRYSSKEIGHLISLLINDMMQWNKYASCEIRLLSDDILYPDRLIGLALFMENQKPLASIIL